MATIDSLRAKVISATSATELDSVITGEERKLLHGKLGLLQPLPWLRTGEARYFGVNNRGEVRAVNCPPAAMRQVWDYRVATDAEILAGLVEQEKQHG
jgi:hypothetical protein